MRPAIAYLRVSTKRQGKSGVGLQAQVAVIATFAQTYGYAIEEAYKDIGTGKGRDGHKRRKGLSGAIAEARARGIPIIVEDLCRLSRNVDTVQEIASLGVHIIACAAGDGRDVELLPLARRKQVEGEAISRRTKEALDELKSQGVPLGNRTNLPEAQRLGIEARKRNAAEYAARILPLIREIQAAGFTSKLAIAAELNRKGITGRRGGKWTSDAVGRVLADAPASDAPTRSRKRKAKTNKPLGNNPVEGSW